MKRLIEWLSLAGCHLFGWHYWVHIYTRREYDDYYGQIVKMYVNHRVYLCKFCMKVEESQ